jgi:hypothetical protein
MTDAHRKNLIRGWDDGCTAEDLATIDELSEVASCTAQAIARFLHVEADERTRIAQGACEWLTYEIDRAGGLLDEDEFMRRCRVRETVTV